jgi:hypothetical protein
LTSVSCTSVEDCVAVGDYISTSEAGVTLAEAWNGVAWTVEKTPSPPGPQQLSALSGVSCPTSGECVAVGATARPASASGRGPGPERGRRLAGGSRSNARQARRGYKMTADPARVNLFLEQLARSGVSPEESRRGGGTDQSLPSPRPGTPARTNALVTRAGTVSDHDEEREIGRRHPRAA